MNNNDKAGDKSENLRSEDSTRYGEFISSFDGWISLEDQKKRASHLESNTKISKKE